MGRYAIKVPDIGEGIAEVELVEWHVKPGDTVTQDQLLADVMTDKATVEVPAPVAGTVVQLGGAPGTLMAVGAQLMQLEVAGEGNVDADAEPHSGARPTAETPIDAPPPSATPTDVMAQAAVPAVKAAPALGEKTLASPAVRQRAWDLGIELQFIPAQHPAGRITHADLDLYLAARAAGRDSHASPGRARRQGETAHPVIGLRRRIAQKMAESKRRIPHFSYVEEVDVTEVEALRGKLNEQHGAARGRLTLLPLLARAIVLAVRDFPQMNARFDDDAGVVTHYGPVHLGIATQTGSGLLVPVLRHAEERDPWATGLEIARLADAARQGKAARDELSGSTITISSLGPLGGIATTPIINHPEVAIVGVNRIVERPAFSGGSLVGRKLMNLSSSFDHRVVDGSDAARFIQAIRTLLETPALLFVD